MVARDTGANVSMPSARAARSPPTSSRASKQRTRDSVGACRCDDVIPGWIESCTNAAAEDLRLPWPRRRPHCEPKRCWWAFPHQHRRWSFPHRGDQHRRLRSTRRDGRYPDVLALDHAGPSGAGAPGAGCAASCGIRSRTAGAGSWGDSEAATEACVRRARACTLWHDVPRCTLAR